MLDGICNPVQNVFFPFDFLIDRASCKTQFLTDLKENEIMQAFVFINFNFSLIFHSSKKMAFFQSFARTSIEIVKEQLANLLQQKIDN
jgi:hypothetical protein